MLILRLIVGLLFVGHGLQKLKGYFGGGGLEATERVVASMDMQPAKVHARAVAAAETFGGAAIALGAATPVASASLIATMLTAIRKVHGKNGPWNSKGGYEFNAVLIASLLSITAKGPGALSVDGLFGRSKWGIRAAIFALVAGAAGSYAAISFGRQSAEALKKLEEFDAARDAETAAPAAPADPAASTDAESA